MLMCRSAEEVCISMKFALLRDVVARAKLRQELNGDRVATMISMQGDIHNIYGILGRHDERLDRIERRLELRELAEPQPTV